METGFGESRWLIKSPTPFGVEAKAAVGEQRAPFPVEFKLKFRFVSAGPNRVSMLGMFWLSW